uniref:Uncharacterized protein n=1 Tax=Anopheles atroparvus TaxID=41427 RepID=A0A182J4U0_ANOAO
MTKRDIFVLHGCFMSTCFLNGLLRRTGEGVTNRPGLLTAITIIIVLVVAPAKGARQMATDGRQLPVNNGELVSPMPAAHLARQADVARCTVHLISLGAHARSGP